MTIVVEGLAEQQQLLLSELENNPPAFSSIQSLTLTNLPSAGFIDFQIMPSRIEDRQSAFIIPDIATCETCKEDVFDPNNRLYLYPFTSCSHCGPRYSIITGQPYDRTRTAMAGFILCDDCKSDYSSPNNRRFHAQTIACSACGPNLQFLNNAGHLLTEKHSALIAAVEQLKAGNIVAVKGIGGYQLLADAANQSAVARLRQRKHRLHKPFALMAPNLEAAQDLCFVNLLEKQALVSSSAPIVLLKRGEFVNPDLISANVAPDSNLLGVMLPCSPLHHLLLNFFGSPVVATSGNRQNETICINEAQALSRLSGIADYFLVHNRPILRPLDDSIVRYINGKMTVLRRARGFAPLPISIKKKLPETLALGGHLKNTVAVCRDNQIILSQHIGDLETEISRQQFQTTLSDLQELYRVNPVQIMHDIHENYSSSRVAAELTGTKHAVQHHYAHALACMAEHGLEPPVLGVVWDGAGLGEDNTLWGGEFLSITATGFQRYASLRPFLLPGGFKAIQEPRRAALGVLYEIFGDNTFERADMAFSRQELNLLQTALKQQINCPKTSSAGRLFDAVASLLTFCHVNEYEGQAAMLLENQASLIETDESYPFQFKPGQPLLIDWQDMIKAILDDLPNTPAELIAAKFHNTLAEIILAVAQHAQQSNIVLSGGCFQNALLTEKAAGKLKSAGFSVHCHEKIPPNDGGLALGQIYALKYIENSQCV